MDAGHYADCLLPQLLGFGSRSFGRGSRPYEGGEAVKERRGAEPPLGLGPSTPLFATLRMLRQSPALFPTRVAAGFRLRFANLHFGLALARCAEGAQEGCVAALGGFFIAKYFISLFHRRTLS